MMYGLPQVVAEIGCNHMGDIATAKHLIDLARDGGADYAKFQKRCNKELLTEEQYNSPHPVPHNSYGETYGMHREALEFSLKQHQELMKYCEKVGIGYATSVWDLTSAGEIISLNPRFIKVPSACNNNIKMLTLLRDQYEGQVQVSLGMTTKDEAEAIVRLFEENGQANTRLMLYACTSGYPVPPEDTCLLEILRLIESYSSRVSEIGFSGHHLGIALDISAYMLGAKWIERHFTKDRSWKGTDHAASLEPQGLSKLVRDLKSVHAALTYKPEEILEIEKPQRDKLKYRGR